MNRRELEMRLDDLFEGVLGEEEFEQLEAELQANPEARAAYREALLLEHTLRFRAKGVDLMHVVPMDEIVARRQRRGLRYAATAAAALLMLGAVVMAFILTRASQPTMTFATSAGAKWMLSHARSGDEMPDGRVMEPGSRLLVERGVVELELVSGVRGVVRGPADLTLRREDLVDLRHGTVWFEVPKKAVGFQVRTPDLVLTDLGTSFGIISKDHFLDEVHVFEGEVEVLHRRALRQRERIVADAARAAGPAGRWGEIPLRPSEFLTQLPAEKSAAVRVDDVVGFTSSPANEMVRQKRYTFEADGDLSGFDPAAADKLVVTLSHERGEIEEVTYGGVRMERAGFANSRKGQQTAIYFLDAPGVAGNLVVQFGKGTSNGVGGAVLALSGTAPNGPVATAAEASSRVDLSAESGCLVVASHAYNGNAEGAQANVKSPLVAAFSGPTGSSAGGVGYYVVKSAGEMTLRFSSGKDHPTTAAVVFAPR